ncbi:MAG: acetate--CoA ligase family protein [Pseudodesulfovibrio sp.]|uniref:CoA-binding domain protein n=1 Tax=Pseudodesulfovibrio aespoeensis (strain ATCC 700646 / DSM 10631 / Aspo-2) TaxID=643562 RepID=E6VRE9_PSEA9|nr:MULTISPECIES: acetate--CoA ligase [Pseudodesulfovibrio]MBU4193124.1 acetate--CoA ligase family protein [Pseudomonadota bacterium]ADU61878.1 CoA-binding domain protein [Pseudodesulfovibrio aespoeensis Aspo-2]MBU4244646.1 acetate--CoA ligase family protein [Pseudomonadota bacterium]MBU4378676.1 acetate--CoA ligase family protein [Pseudomonadota bacterium]MBU4476365.1 acetate--CoA ligase family protein [Pseudomonadota bacterium]
MTVKQTLHAFFYPETVAVIGASASPGKIGHTVMTNMIGAGFRGKLFPVNPKGGTIEGMAVVRDIADLPRGLDLAVLAVPRDHVEPSIQALAGIGVKSVIVITAGFKEVGKDGYRLEQELKALCEAHSIAMLGPNCLGMMNPAHGVNASFAAGQPKAGSIAFFSQSGALCVAILDWALGENIGFSKFISLGNKAVIDEADMLGYLGGDAQTKVILGYIENVEHGEAFLRQARAVCRNKPVIMIKAGTTAAGAKAASSHTGAIAGSDQTYTAAFRQSGVIRVADVASLFNLAQAFSTQPLPRGPNLAVVTNSGGPGILTADIADRSRLTVAELSQRTIERLQEFLPSYAAFYNPVDIVGDADAKRYRRTLDVVADDPVVHSILVLLTPTASVEIEKTAEAVIHTARKCGKPVFACFMGKTRVARARAMLMEAGIPCYAFPEPAVRSIESMYEYYLWKNRPEPVYAEFPCDRELALKVVREHEARREPEIVEFQAQEVLRAYGLPTPKTVLARSSEEAVAAAVEIGYPVVLKIASPNISHKSDVGGVKVNLRDAGEVLTNFREITARAMRMRPDAYIAGCLVQEMAPPGVKEVIIGFKRDEQFGPMLMFGLGGIYVEIMKDISFKLAPLSRQNAFEIVREIKSYMLLKGLRGEKPVNFAALEEIILIMSQMALDLPQVWEAEFNPVLINHERAMVADVRMTLHLKEDRE